MNKTFRFLSASAVLIFSAQAFAEDSAPAAAPSPPQATQDQSPASTPEVRSQPQVHEKKGYGSVLFGNASILSTGGGNAMNYAVRLGGDIHQDNSGAFSLGAYLGSWGSSSVSSTGAIVDGRVTAILLEVGSRKVFHTGLYGGGRFGTGLTTLAVSGVVSGSASSLAFMVGPYLGYSVPLSNAKEVSLDIDASWLTRSATTLLFTDGSSASLTSVSALVMQLGVGLSF